MTLTNNTCINAPNTPDSDPAFCINSDRIVPHHLSSLQVHHSILWVNVALGNVHSINSYSDDKFLFVNHEFQFIIWGDIMDGAYPGLLQWKG